MLNDETLILQAQRGDMKSFEALVHRYDRRVLSMALSYSGDPDDAKDIYQEVFLRVYRALPRFEHRSQFSTWLYRIAANVCKSYYSRTSSRRQVSLDRSPQGEQGLRLVDVLESGDSADKRAIGSSLMRRVEQALGTLSPKQRLVFCLRHYQGHKLREIADLLDCAEGTVKRHLFTAVRRLRQELQPVVREGWHS